MDYNIGRSITDYMKENKIRQVMLARMINYDPGNLCRLLKKNNIDLDMVVKISVALKFNFLCEVSCQLTEEIVKSEPDGFNLDNVKSR
ncbi:MAG: hypothetical protein Q4F69_04400 [Bacteroidia bacterium]|nr:hypothetical protein [Bacteroidia bacterium]